MRNSPPIDRFAGVLYAIRAGQRGKWAAQARHRASGPAGL